MSTTTVLNGEAKKRTAVKNKCRFPMMTNSLCPECLDVIEARINRDEGSVYMEKSCPKHGPFRELISPDPKFLDVEPLMDKMSRVAEDLGKKRIFRKLTIARALQGMERYFHQDRAPSGWTFETCVDFMMDFADFRKRFADNKARPKKVAETSHRPLLMASMHFQDTYNYQIERVQRCVVQYAALDGRLYPFCTYNCGPCHRGRVEKQFAVPLDRYRAMSAQKRRSGEHKN